MVRASFLLLAILFVTVQSRAYLSDFGAIPHQDDYAAQVANQQAFLKAIQYLNQSSPVDRVLVIPANKYYFLPVYVSYVHNLSVLVLGKVIASKSIRDWPHKPAPSHGFLDFIVFEYCDNLSISGGGKIDGRGYHWWVVTWLNIKKLLDNQGGRPDLLRFNRCRNLTIHDLILKNSPQFHVRIDDTKKALIYNLDIKVNTTAQFNLAKRFSVEGVIPINPLNTDGVDPHGTDMHIYNLNVQNWDDVVVPKPGTKGDIYGNCTQNILVENITVKLGVGMSIGSIPPADNFRCIRNVTFRNVHMQSPWKGIYVKTNPGNNGGGLGQNIWYQNITMIRPNWWAIYIGPQQMKEPDRGGPGCLFYPFDPKGTCGTQPRVTLRNITLKDVHVQDSLLYPITIRCNASNPCREFDFQNVTVSKWRLGQKKTGMVCEYATGKQSMCKPQIYCFYDGYVIPSSEIQEERQELWRQQIPQDEQLDVKLVWQRLEQAFERWKYSDEDDDDMGFTEEFRTLTQGITW